MSADVFDMDAFFRERMSPEKFAEYIKRQRPKLRGNKNAAGHSRSWMWAEWRFSCAKCPKRCAECEQRFQYSKAFGAVRHILRRIAAALKAGPEEMKDMKMEAVARPTVDNDEIGINTVLQESYGLFRDVVNGKITSQTAGAAARNCANVLKGLELRARFGPEALKF